MTRAIGGYVRRSERRYVKPLPLDGSSRCGFCSARLDFITPWNHPHICKEIIFQSMPILNPIELFGDLNDTNS